MNAENDKNNRLHLAGTNEWIFDHIMFKNWSSGAVQVLWISGIPGKGMNPHNGTFILEGHNPRSASGYVVFTV